MTNLSFVKNPKEVLQKEITRHENELAFYLEVFNELKKLEYSTLSKRLETKLQKALPDVEFHFSLKYSWYELRCLKVIDDCYCEIKIMLAYQSESNDVNVEILNKRNTPYTIGSVDAIRELKAALPNVEQAINDIEQAQNALNNAIDRLGLAKYVVTAKG